jgi:SAM-dependent methyltransferase
MTATSDWWQTFFSGWTVEAWLKAMTPEQTRQEADFIRESLGISPPVRLLDVPCGGGRHCRALASDGYDMTGVDISSEFLEAARLSSASHPAGIAWEHREMRDLPWPGAFDGAYCFGNSFGYLDESGNAEFLRAVANTLKPGARFVLETGYVAETLLPALQERAWYPVGEDYWLANRRYDPVEGRLHVEYIYIHEGTIDRRTMSARVHTCREVIRLLEQAGFTDVQTYGSLAKEPFRLGSKNLLAVAMRS